MKKVNNSSDFKDPKTGRFGYLQQANDDFHSIGGKGRAAGEVVPSWLNTYTLKVIICCR